MPNQNYGSQRFSRLDEINRDNAAYLQVAFTVPLNHCLRGRNTVTNSGQPLVDGGFLFIEGCTGFLYKVDITAGNYGTILWTADAGVEAPAGGAHRGGDR
jgi:glucose dehydrogenase